jgi:protein-disulfide isomerase
MSKASHGGKWVALVLIVIVAAAAIYGYSKQTKTLAENDADAQAATSPDAETAALLKVKPSDIVIGDPNALTTIVEYSSLSCPHCAHFHETVLPDLTKEFITPGKVKLVVRHFPLNEPALKGAELVECAGQTGLERANFVKVLFDLQSKWAFDENFLKNLKQIALVGGMDSAGFDSCMADKGLETKILAERQVAQDKLKINGTPAFFINGVAYDGDRSIDGFQSAIKSSTQTTK